MKCAKTYRATLGGGADEETALCASLRRGVELDDGPTAPARVRRIEREPARADDPARAATARCGGCARTVGHPVLALERIAFGRLRLEGLAPGLHRRLSGLEIARLRAL